MSRDPSNHAAQDPLLDRYREANALDPARPGPALRENVLAHARAVAASRIDKAPPETRSAANDSVWSWWAVASLAMVGLVGLLVLQFDRGTPEEKQAAFGTAVQRPAPPASAPVTPAAPAAGTVPEQEATSGLAPLRPPVVQAPARSGAEPAAVDSARSASKMASAQEPEAALVPSAPPAPAAPSVSTAPVAPPAPMAAAKPAPMAKAAEAPAVMAPASPAPAPIPAPALAPPPAPALAEGSSAGAAAPRSPAPGLARERRENNAADAVATTPVYPLHTAVAAGDAAAVRQWLARGANPNQRDAKEQTPLMLAADRGDGAIVRLLVDAGADRRLRDPQGLSAADHAERAGHPELLPLLR